MYIPTIKELAAFVVIVAVILGPLLIGALNG